MIELREMEYWPSYTTPNERSYTINHVKLLEKTLVVCKSFRTAIQAGGSIGYWPRRMAERFDKVITFEPEPLMYDCLVKNLINCKNIEVYYQALGEKSGRCSIQRRGFGSHIVVLGDDVEVIAIDSLELNDLDLLQLDIEGYEDQALVGGLNTIKRCRPVVHLEILEGDEMKQAKERIIRGMMNVLNYRERLHIGRDVIFVPN